VGRLSKVDADALVASVPGLAVLHAVDPGPHFTYFAVNDRAVEALGVAADDLLGRDITEMFGPGAETQLAAMLDRAVATGHPVPFTTVLPLRDGPMVMDAVLTAYLDEGRPVQLLWAAVDASSQQAAKEALERSEARFRSLVHNAFDGVGVVGEDGRYLWSSPALDRLMGLEPGALVGVDALSRVHPDDVEEAGRQLASTIDTTPGGVTWVGRALHADGSWRTVEVTGADLRHDPNIGGIVLNARDVTDQHRAEEALRLQGEVLELIARGRPLVEVLGRLARGVSELCPGVRTSVVLIHEWGELEYGDGPDEGDELVWSSPVRAADDGRQVGEVRLWDHGEPDAADLVVVARLSPMVAIAVERASAEEALRASERQYRALALHDALTGLPNRILFDDRVRQALAGLRRRSGMVAVLFCDLDGFKWLNDSYGHAVGDRVVVEMGKRIGGALRTSDTVARFGGDEFVVLLEDTDASDDAAPVAERLLDELQRPFRIGDKEVFLTVSVGIAASRTTGLDLEQLLRHADAAMYTAKGQGRARIEVHERTASDVASTRLQMETDLHRAVSGGELALLWQPKVSLRTGHIVGVETLVRWQHPDHGLILPEQFIPVAEDIGLITTLGRWVLSEALREAREISRQVRDRGGWSIAVNLSARQLQAPRFVGEVAALLRQWGWPAGRLVFELTEGVLMDEATDAPLHRLKQFGLELAIDDFGTGYSSLSYLHRFPVSMVKLDKAFVHGITADGEGSPVARAVIQMAHALGITATAEGVENADQLSGLRALGCDWAQGYHLARPMPADEFAALLGEHPSFI
jgi:diguanylate cyclase (GGDEF)-like protein/PAS domain S-box-containing protein